MSRLGDAGTARAGAHRTMVAVFGSSTTTPQSPEWQQAHTLGRRLAEAGFDIVTGGYGGSMEAVGEGARAAGGGTRHLGVTAPKLFSWRTGPNRYVDLEIPAETLSERIGTLLQRSDAAVALPGSLGTLTEILMAWTELQLAEAAGVATRPLVAVGAVWRDLLLDLAAAFDQLPPPFELASDVDEAVSRLRLALRRRAGG